ncbi:F-box protein CPR30 [Sesamum indicum]|uniref:F-box protein CPR30 n=1 Tax=Sesamum indicum TaxID=4182 RepID=A0A6I9U6Y8_SESIN|nr:F-box protein CPR30 [Sesamum indicum]
MADYFPTELLIEILLRLPVKSLIRFTAVCKSWHALITSPSFISSHLSNTRNHTLLARRYDKHDKRERYSLLEVAEGGPFAVKSSSELGFPFKSQIGYFRIVGSCDGLVCLSDDFFANPSQPVILWNPSVRNHVILPKPTINPTAPHIFVLGFGVAAHDYKVVRLVYCRKLDDFGFILPPQIEVFSLKTGRWRRVRRVDVRLQVLEFMWCQTFLNGVVHWIAYESTNDDSTRSSILAFRVGDEVFDEMKLPTELAREPVTNLCISLIGESLGVLKYYREAGNESCDVWMMKEYGAEESWTKLYRIDLFNGIEKVVAFWKNGEALVALQGLELAAYNQETKQTKELGIYGTTRSFYVDNYVESLLLMRGHGGANVDPFEDLSLEDGCCIV